MSGIDIDISAFGLANDWYQPVCMQRPHRHNEVELNFIEQGSITYLFGGTRTSVKAGQMARRADCPDRPSPSQLRDEPLPQELWHEYHRLYHAISRVLCSIPAHYDGYERFRDCAKGGLLLKR
jgi:hypothetical protein